MSKSKTAMGRNPLDKLSRPQEQTQKRYPHLELPTPKVTNPASGLGAYVGLNDAVDKIREMEIQVDWQELYKSTLGSLLSRFNRRSN